MNRVAVGAGPYTGYSIDLDQRSCCFVHEDLARLPCYAVVNNIVELENALGGFYALVAELRDLRHLLFRIEAPKKAVLAVELGDLLHAFSVALKKSFYAETGAVFRGVGRSVRAREIHGFKRLAKNFLCCPIGNVRLRRLGKEARKRADCLKQLLVRTDLGFRLIL